MESYDNIVVYSSRDSFRVATSLAKKSWVDEKYPFITWTESYEGVQIPNIVDTDYIKFRFFKDLEDDKVSSDKPSTGIDQVQSEKGEKEDQGGPAGKDGKSIYDIAVENGYKGTEEDLYNLLVLFKRFEKDGVKRKTIELENYDNISGKDTKGIGHNLVMLSRWNVADFGAVGVHCNFNGKSPNPTYNDKQVILLASDLIELGLIDQDKLTEFINSKIK